METGYEARNLRMVANIRAAFGNMPGGRVLNVVFAKLVAQAQLTGAQCCASA